MPPRSLPTPARHPDDTAEALEWAKRAQDGEQFRFGTGRWIACVALRAGAWREVQRAIRDEPGSQWRPG